MHNTAGVPILITDLIDKNTDHVSAGASGMDGMVKWKGGEWEECSDSIMQILYTICFVRTHLFLGFLIRFSLSWHGGLQMSQASLARPYSRRGTTFCANTRSMSYLFPQRPLSTRAQKHCGTSTYPIPLRSQAECTRDSWGNIAVLLDGFAGVSHVSVTSGPTLASTYTSRPVRENCTRPSCGTRVPKYVLLPVLVFSSSYENTQLTPFPLFNNQTPE